MTAPATNPAPSSPPVVPVPPPSPTWWAYRHRLRASYTAAAQERIDKAETAAAELALTDSVPWDDIGATYTRPARTPWKSLRILLGQAFAVAFLVSLLLGFLAGVLLSLDLREAESLAAEKKQTLSAEERAKIADRAKRGVRNLAVVFVVVYGASACNRFMDKRKAMRAGYAKDGDEVATEALDALPALAVLAAAPGRARTEALTEVHERLSELMSAVTTSTGTAAGITRYMADRGRLSEHGQKVRTAFTDKLGKLVEPRERTTRELASMALTVASRQAQATYGALLDAAALPAEPGPEVVDVKALRKVFLIAGAAAAVSLVVAPSTGAQGAGLFFIPLAAFLLAAVLAAAFTRSLHQLGRVFAMFNRGNGDAGGGGAAGTL